MKPLTPMGAVAALYSEDDRGLAAEVAASLSHVVFGPGEPELAGSLRRKLARITHRVVAMTTTASWTTNAAGQPRQVFRNRLLERSGHPYAFALLGAEAPDHSSSVEGGDSMNGPYMMLVPDIRSGCRIWDRLLLDSVQGRDVQARLVWEARAVYRAAQDRLARGGTVRLKAVAAGAGLCLTLVHDRLIRDGVPPERLIVRITDREESNVLKAGRLIASLALARARELGVESGQGISTGVEDIFHDTAVHEPVHGGQWHAITAIGILEYFPGSSTSTTERRLGLDPAVAGATGHDLVERLAAMTTDDGVLILNTYRDDPAARILELLGKRFVYRSREDLERLMAGVGFRPACLMGSGTVYDVEVFERTAVGAGVSHAAQGGGSGQEGRAA